MKRTTTDQRRWGLLLKELPPARPTRPARTRRRSQSYPTHDSTRVPCRLSQTQCVYIAKCCCTSTHNAQDAAASLMMILLHTLRPHSVSSTRVLHHSHMAQRTHHRTFRVIYACPLIRTLTDPPGAQQQSLATFAASPRVRATSYADLETALGGGGRRGYLLCTAPGSLTHAPARLEALCV